MVFSPEDGTNGAAMMMMEKMCYHSAKPPAPVHKDPWDASFEHARRVLCIRARRRRRRIDVSLDYLLYWLSPP